LDLGPEADLEIVVASIGLQVPGHAVARHPPALAPTDSKPRQAGQTTDGVEVKAVVVVAPVVSHSR
jgi:hypothetical protein